MDEAQFGCMYTSVYVLNRSSTYLAANKIRKQNIFGYEEYLNGNIFEMNER